MFVRKNHIISNKSKAGCFIANNQTVSKIRSANIQNTSEACLRSNSKNLINKALRGIQPEDMLVEAFALVCEAANRTLGIHVFDTQLLAGIELHNGNMIEMQTGEGKTLAAVFPAYLNALEKKGVHILTFNDYLAKRDATWMGPVFELLGLSVGYINEGMSSSQRKAAYDCDITYVTAKEAGFDYLRDSLCYDKDMLVHRPFNYVIIDEADSIMIDEARLPLVIAAGLTQEKNLKNKIVDSVKKLQPEMDYNTDEALRNVYLTDTGIKKVEAYLGCVNLYEAENAGMLADVYNILHAEVLLKRDVDYIVRDGRIEIVDEFTGRVAENRHWPDRLQAAVEAKEGLSVASRGQILSSISIQSFIHLYSKISGMTGTAISSSREFFETYGLNTVAIPANRASIRVDYPDKVFFTREEKYTALINEIKAVNLAGRPILIGTGSISESERILELLNANNIDCQVLNAKNDELEAEIIANSGALRAVTVSTNMAGRGTDIKLGGTNEKDRHRVIELGGLYVMGTNRHESIRIDNQLRGRAGRQGDPGSSKFFVSLEDELFCNSGIDKLIPFKNHRKDVKMFLNGRRFFNKILQFQRIAEGQNFEIRKTLWRYSNVIELQRRYIFSFRGEILEGRDIPLRNCEEKLYQKLLEKLGPTGFKNLKRDIALYVIDQNWADYLEHISYIRDGIHLVAVGGKNPLEEYMFQVTEAFDQLKEHINDGIIDMLKNIKITENGINTGDKALKGPASTWTYLINDNPFEDDLGLMLASTRNIGFTAVAAVIPLISVSLIASLIYQRFFKRGKHIV